MIRFNTANYWTIRECLQVCCYSISSFLHISCYSWLAPTKHPAIPTKPPWNATILPFWVVKFPWNTLWCTSRFCMFGQIPIKCLFGFKKNVCHHIFLGDSRTGFGECPILGTYFTSLSGICWSSPKRNWMMWKMRTFGGFNAGTPSPHPLLDGILQEINHPAMGVPPNEIIINDGLFASQWNING